MSNCAVEITNVYKRASLVFILSQSDRIHVHVNDTNNEEVTVFRITTLAHVSTTG